jgi:hypothetical protein
MSWRRDEIVEELGASMGIVNATRLVDGLIAEAAAEARAAGRAERDAEWRKAVIDVLEPAVDRPDRDSYDKGWEQALAALAGRMAAAEAKAADQEGE